MSGIDLFIDEIDSRLHAAVMRKNVLTDLYVDALDQEACWGTIYLGRVTKIDKKLDAAIVDLGNNLMGLLPAKHVYVQNAGPAADRSGIADLLSPGQMVMVQVKSEARKASTREHHKMPRLTMLIYIMGQFLIHSPVAGQVTISSRIENDSVLKFTSRLKGKGGWLVQHNAEDATEEQLLSEAKMLRAEWQRIADTMEATGDKPRLIKAGPTALVRALNDLGARRFEHIHVGNKDVLAQMTDWCAKHDPALATSKRLRLFRPEHLNQKLFEIHDIYSEISTLEESVVYLNGGGSIIIEHTHAVIMIDVNQGNGTSASAVNQEAAQEVSRQIRLRNLSGAILVDFIGMHLKSERIKLVELMEDLLAWDTGSAEVHGFTRLGIIELTRKRRTATYAEKQKVYLAK
jgi:ribonuclease G